MSACSAVPLLRTESSDTSRYLHTCVPSSIAHNSQRLETTHVSTASYPGMDKQDAAHPDNAIRSNLEKEGDPDTCCDMDEPGGHHAKRKRPVVKGQIPHDSPCTSYLKWLDSWRQKVDVQARGQGPKDLVFEGDRFSAGDDEEGWRWVVATAPPYETYLLSLNCTLRNSYSGSFHVMYILQR